MTGHREPESSIAPADQDLVLSELEPDQLAAVKKHRLARRKLKGFETFTLWSLRIYVLFMIAVVLYQVWTGAR